MKNLLIIIALILSVLSSNAQVNRDDIRTQNESLKKYTSVEDSIKFMNLKQILLKYEKEEWVEKEVKTNDDYLKHNSMHNLFGKINAFEKAKYAYRKFKKQINSYPDSEWQERYKLEQNEWLYLQQIRLSGSAIEFEANKLGIKY